MMDYLNRHVGFHQDAPEEVVWSQASFIRPVMDLDERKIRGIIAGGTICFLGMLVLAGAVAAMSKTLGERFPVLENSFLLISSTIILPSVFLGIFSGTFYKWLMITKIRSRSESLFDPDWGCYFVGIEDAFTYDKRKLTGDDFGLLKIEHGRLQLEMTKYRAQFDISELGISLLHTSKNAVGVRLTSKNDPHTWSVVLSPTGNTMNIFKLVNIPGKSKRLLEILTQAGAKAQPESPPQTDTVDYVSADDIILDDDDRPQIQSVSTPVIEHADVMENRYADVLEAIRQKQQKRKKGWLKSMGIMVISLFVFFQLGFFRWGFEAVMMILLVLFIHEMGHFIAMKLCGYKNLQMFFIPLAGAAVSGESRNVPAWKKAIVSLSGPLPGIAIGCFLLIVSAIINQNLLLLTGAMFVALNLLNLLPINPLDGGRFLNEVLLSRNRYFELIANILAALVFLIAGFALKSWIFKILGLLNLFTIQYKFKLSTSADQFKKQWSQNPHTDDSLDNGPEDDIPENLLKQMISWIYKNLPGPMKTKVVATTVLQLWDKIRIHPPKAGATVGLLVLYIMGYIFSFVSIGAFAVYYVRNNMYKTEIVEYTDDNGQTKYKEVSYWMGDLNSETQLTDDKKYYHGSYKAFNDDGAVIATGQWDNGLRAGQWDSYDPNNVLCSQTHYEQGKPVLIRTRIQRKWTEQNWDDFTDFQKNLYKTESQTQQGPQIKPQYEFDEVLYEPNNIPLQEPPVQLE